MNKTEAFSKTVLENLDIPLFIVDENIKVVECNKALLNLIGLEKTDIIGKKTSEITAPVLKKILNEGDFKRVIETGESYHREDKIEALTKEKFIETLITPVRGEDEAIEGAITLLLDITESHEREEKLREDYNKLKYLDETVENLISNVSHELKTPLAICLSGIELLTDEEDRDKRIELLDMFRNSLIRQSRIINDLVGISKLRSGNIKLNVEELDLETVVAIAKREMEFLTIKKNIEININIEPDLPKVRYDFDELKHILNNLLDNAIKFNQTGGEVTIEAINKGNQIEVCVVDTGIGIDQEKIGRVFERFYQADGSTTRNYAGTGMGLAIVKEIVKAYNGGIWAESEKGKGSRFYFTLPTVTPKE